MIIFINFHSENLQENLLSRSRPDRIEWWFSDSKRSPGNIWSCLEVRQESNRTDRFTCLCGTLPRLSRARTIAVGLAMSLGNALISDRNREWRIAAVLSGIKFHRSWRVRCMAPSEGIRARDLKGRIIDIWEAKGPDTWFAGHEIERLVWKWSHWAEERLVQQRICGRFRCSKEECKQYRPSFSGRC
jgi:hypothetical protein